MNLIASYGLWASPITPEWLTHSQKKFGNIVLDGSSVYWDESRPNEGGRSLVMQRKADGTLLERTPDNVSCRSRVHEYGGAPFTVSKDLVYYVNDKDGRVYLEKEPLTESGIRCADLQISGAFLIGVGEKEGKNFLFSCHLPTKTTKIIASGNDFYASPAISPDGKQIAYLTWDLPNMPWDGTTLWTGLLREGDIENVSPIAGGSTESIFQPSWSPSGALYFVSDRTGWWNLYKNGEPVFPMEEEFGFPQWIFGMSTYAFIDENTIASCSTKDGLFHMYPFSLPWTFYTQIRAANETVVFIGASATQDRSIISYNIKTKKTTTLAHNPLPHLDPGTLSLPEIISFPSHGRISHAIYYPPCNKEWSAPQRELPPLIVISHGGPTAQAFPIFDLKVQFWTSRGFAVVDVNYAGSTGYGRPYRDSLKENWGIFDVQDCEAAAQFLIDNKKVDKSRIAIRGGSAGGYTTLAALTFGSTFTVGASYYGVSDLTALAKETHKFESRYLDTLIGPYPQYEALYKERSPLFHVDRLSRPIIFFQGAEDLVVPLSQAEKMYDALKAKGITTELVVYEGEQHGFRKAENIKDSLMRELAFYLKVWGTQ